MAVRQDASTGKLVDDGKPLDQPAEANALHVKVYSPFHTYYDDAAQSLSAVNETGPFDVLLHHHNFISLLEPCVVEIVTTAGQTKRIKIASGIIHVKSDSATIMLDV